MQNKDTGYEYEYELIFEKSLMLSIHQTDIFSRNMLISTFLSVFEKSQEMEFFMMKKQINL